VKNNFKPPCPQRPILFGSKINFLFIYCRLEVHITEIPIQKKKSLLFHKTAEKQAMRLKRMGHGDIQISYDGLLSNSRPPLLHMMPTANISTRRIK